MGCKHEHLRTVGDRLFCKDCGTELPLEFLTNGKEIPKAADKQEQAENLPVEEKKTKATARKTAAKKSK